MKLTNICLNSKGKKENSQITKLKNKRKYTTNIKNQRN